MSDIERGGWPPAWRLLGRQIRHQNTMFWRSPIAAVFTLAFPAMFLLLFNLLFEGEVDVGEGEIPAAQFFAPSLAVFAAVSATYTALVMQTVSARDLGVVKRVQATPLPGRIYLAGQVLSVVWIAALGTVLMMALGWAAFDVEVEVSRLPAAVVAFGVGAAAFSALGLAVSGFAPDTRSASALANFTLLPMAFVSDVFIPIEDPPKWLELVGDVLPLKPFVHAFGAAFNPNVAAPAIEEGRLLVLAAWFVVAGLVAVGTYRRDGRATIRTQARTARRR